MPNKYAHNLRKLRLNEKLTQSEFANKIGIKRGTYASYESDIEPKIEFLELVSKTFKCKLSELTKVQYSKSLSFEERQYLRSSINTEIKNRFNKIVGLIDDKPKPTYMNYEELAILNDEMPDNSFEALQYKVEYLMEKLVEAQIEINEKNTLIAALNKSLSDKDEIIALQKKLIK